MNLYRDSSALEVGVDESGRGSFLGRIYAGACIWNPEIESPLIKDSKKFKNAKDREIAYSFLKENAIAYSFAYVEPWDIDKIGIGKANILAFHNAIKNLYINVDHILVDGISFKPYQNLDGTYPEFSKIIQGDSKYYSIAGASIIAKCEHDRYIKDLLKSNQELEKYGLETNMGYGTEEHREAIGKYGITKWHRKYFIHNIEFKTDIIEDF